MQESPEMQRWQAESDARTLAEATAINGNADRLNAAQAAAGRLVADQTKRAADEAAKAAAMKKIAGTRYPTMEKMEKQDGNG